MKNNNFKFITFSGREFNFFLDEDNKLYCKELNGLIFKGLLIKPNFGAITENVFFLNFLDEYARKRLEKKDLIKKVVIDEELLNYMHANNMIKFSSDMALFYNLDPKLGYDYKNKKNAFKWAKKKGKILTKQKEGIFD